VASVEQYITSLQKQVYAATAHYRKKNLNLNRFRTLSACYLPLNEVINLFSQAVGISNWKNSILAYRNIINFDSTDGVISTL